MNRFTILTVSVHVKGGTHRASLDSVFRNLPKGTPDYQLFVMAVEALVSQHGDVYANPNTRLIDFFHIGSA